jgi:hypothetical protein
VTTAPSPRLLWLAAPLLALAAYLAIGAAPPVADDWYSVDFIGGWVRDGSLVGRAFEPYESHWSPVFVLGSGLALWLDPAGHGVAPLRAFNALALALSLLAFIRLATWLGASRLAAALAAALLTFHQAVIGVQYQWDSIGPMWGDALCRWAAVLALAPLLGRHRPSVPGHLAVFALTFVALASKETALATLAGTGVLILGATVLRPATPQPLRLAATALAPMVLAVLIFLVIRQTSGGATDLPDTPYGIASALAWPKSLAMLAGALLSPVSTLALWHAAHLRDYAVLAAGAAAALAVAWFVLPALRQRRPPDAAPAPIAPLALALAIPAAFFPMVLMRHVSENYLTPSTFFFALLLALAIDRRLAAAATPARRALTLAAITAIVALHTASWSAKRDVLRATGEESVRIAHLYYPAVDALPDTARVQLRSAAPPPAVPTYSMYGSLNPRGVLFVELHLDGRTVDVIAPHQTATHTATLDGQTVTVREVPAP